MGYPVVSADVNPLENGGWQALGIYAAVAVAILALACLLCIRRRSELSGDVAAFPWMRPVLRYGVGCMGGLALGMILYSVTFGLARSNDIRAYLPGMLLCVVLMTLVCSFGMSMLLGKSLKIFRRTWKGTVLLAALLAAVCVCVRMDVAGVERRVPKTDEIESISVQCRYVQSFTATSEDTETVEAIRAIHRAVLDQMKDGDVDLDGTPLIEDGQYIWIRLKYTLTDGSALERAYNVPVRRASALYTAINQMLSTPQVRHGGCGFRSAGRQHLLLGYRRLPEPHGGGGPDAVSGGSAGRGPGPGDQRHSVGCRLQPPAGGHHRQRLGLCAESGKFYRRCPHAGAGEPLPERRRLGERRRQRERRISLWIVNAPLSAAAGVCFSEPY